MNLQQNTFELADINETLIDEITFFIFPIQQWEIRGV